MQAIAGQDWAIVRVLDKKARGKSLPVVTCKFSFPGKAFHSRSGAIFIRKRRARKSRRIHLKPDYPSILMSDLSSCPGSVDTFVCALMRQEMSYDVDVQIVRNWEQ